MLVAATAAICIKKHFHTLYPGQSMVEQFQVFKEGWPYKLFDKHEHHGMTYRFEGKIIQWWNWGTLEVRLVRLSIMILVDICPGPQRHYSKRS